MKSRFTNDRDGKGTKEWSDKSYNICRGCEHACLYCYAKAQRCRFDPVLRKPGEWDKQGLNKNYKTLGSELGAVGVVMFPTSHDITPNFVGESLQTIRNLLVNNDVLVVTKPHLAVVKELCKGLADYKTKLLFRFTIGSLKPAQCAFWEPGAPSPLERIKALQHAFAKGFQTSVSIEPMLDDRAGIVELVSVVEPFVTDTIWVGKMQRVPQKYNAHILNFATELAKVKARQTDGEILELVRALTDRSKVRWKDSIKAVIEKESAFESAPSE
jgi:DNA repair photolyase